MEVSSWDSLVRDMARHTFPDIGRPAVVAAFAGHIVKHDFVCHCRESLFDTFRVEDKDQ